MMITAHLPLVFAADEGEGSSDSGGDDKGSSDNSDSGSKDDGDSDKQSDSKSSSDSSEEKKDEQSSQDSEQDRGVLGEENKSPIDRDKLKGTPEEQEKTAQEDHEADKLTDDQLPNVKEWKPTSENEFCANKVECDKLDHPEKYPVNNPYHPKYCDKWNHKCKPHPNPCDSSRHYGNCHPIHHPHPHPDWCDHHDCHHHKHHSNTHFSDNHHGDVTVKVHVTDYKSNDLSDVHLIIGDVYEKNLNLNSEPDQIKVDNLDIDGGDDFAVCLANEDSDEGDCVVTHADSDHDEVNVNLKVL